MKIYFAGPLFTQAERFWNTEIAEQLRGEGFEVFLPQDEVPDAFRPEELFKTNVAGIRAADAVVAVLDGADADSGTAWECGFAFALGKPVVALRTDLRAAGDDSATSLNLMLSESARSVILDRAIGSTLEATTQALVRKLRDIR